MMIPKPDNQFMETHLERRSPNTHRFLTKRKIVWIDFLLLNVAFFFCHFLKKYGLLPNEDYTKLLLLFYMSWALRA